MTARQTVGVATANRNAADLRPDQLAERELAIRKAIAQEERAIEQLRQAEARQAGLSVERQQQLLAASQQRLALLGQMRDVESSIIGRESAKLQGLQEQYGAKTPAERAALLGVGQKIARGEQLNPGEIQYAMGNREFFGEKFSQSLRQAGDQAGFADLVKMLGLDRQLKEAQERRERIEGDINVQVKVDEKSMRFSTEAVAAQLNEALDRIKELIDRRLRDMGLASRDHREAAIRQ
jgi:hypothetical protein